MSFKNSVWTKIHNYLIIKGIVHDFESADLLAIISLVIIEKISYM